MASLLCLLFYSEKSIYQKTDNCNWIFEKKKNICIFQMSEMGTSIQLLSWDIVIWSSSLDIFQKGFKNI